eukprot:1158471-Pelagomonas_calceolata.AAC.14
MVCALVEAFLVGLLQFGTGIWWMEYHRLHRAQDVIELAAAGGKTLSLPSGFAAGQELLKDTGREHCRCVCVNRKGIEKRSQTGAAEGHWMRALKVCVVKRERKEKPGRSY